jgi:para-aminobenzoate synthetase component 1
MLAKELIHAGEIYQANLSQQFVFSGTCRPFSIFFQLAQLNPAPFSAYLKVDDFAIVSSSPERFLSCSDGILETRPIKGTAPRGKTEEEDCHLKEQLLASEKEKAELLMITDLMRNDLGRLSMPGTVKTLKLWECESYTNVFHLVSTIQSKSLDIHPVDKVRACFPGGSISGCPKLSAMEAIQRIEKRRRGIYTGGIGYFTENGDFDFNIAIRTLLIEKEKLTVQVGGGIVADSDPEKEYQETLHKGASIFKVLGVDIV